MTRRQSLVLAVALLVALAGCSGSFTSDASDDSGLSEENVEPATPAQKLTPSSGVLNKPTPNLSEGDTVDWNSSERVDAHISAVSRQRNVTVDRTLTVNTESETLNFSYETRIDFESGEAVRYASMPLLSNQRKYTTSGATYSWTTFAYKNRTMDTYNVYLSPYSSPSNPINGSVELGANHLNFGKLRVVHKGNTTVNGDNLTRYRSYGVSSVSLPDTRATGQGTLQSFNATLLIDEDGIIRYASWNATVSGADGPNVQHIRYEQSVSDLGNTTVSQPDWVEKVQQKAD